ncbi:HEAT repeat domain-containing protein [Lignipirellula cremea]|uniref:HEAT repeat protein n=1 Tax=Lignipirellula cremea TaxID=2528010 RepID=A0A518E2P7_9BACT|nr:HEAT repeat domain-containing protein [Lignipirellula cremea]QDU98369.1 HEAT repeat protein [Lignipirellula cremea]
MNAWERLLAARILLVFLGVVLIAGICQGQEPAAGAAAAGEPAAAYGGKSLAAWIALAEEGDDDQRRQAYYALGEMRPPSPEATAALVAGLEDGAIVGRRYATAALGNMGPLAAAATPALMEAITSEVVKDEFIQLHAVQTLGQIGPGAAAALPLLQRQLAEGPPLIRVAAAHSIWQIAQDRNAVAALIRELERPANEAPFAAALSLLAIGPVADEALPALVQALSHADADVRRAAAKATAAYGMRAIPLISEALGDADPQAAAAALGFIFDQVRNETLYNPQTSIADFRTAAAALIHTGAPAAAAIMTNPQAEPAARTAGLHALARLGPLALVQLLTALQSDQPPVRAAALEGMQRLEQFLPRKPIPNIDAVKRSLADRLVEPLTHEDPLVRKTVIHLYAALEIGPYGSAAIPALRKALREETDGGVRSDASQALNRLLQPE